MKIKKLIVRKTKPSEVIIREITFNEKGLSLIVDNTPENIIESGNSVGKSTAIKIIDLCLGAKSVRELYYDSDTRSENIEVKDFLSENKVQAELILLDVNKNIYSIEEISYYLYNYLYLIDDKFFSEELIEYIDKELDQTHIAAGIRQIIANGGELGEKIAFVIKNSECL